MIIIFLTIIIIQKVQVQTIKPKPSIPKSILTINPTISIPTPITRKKAVSSKKPHKIN